MRRDILWHAIAMMICLPLLCVPALAECQASYSSRPGTRSDGTVSGAKAGESCHIPAYLNSPGMRASGTTLAGIDVVRQPKRGAVRSEGSAIIYTPNSAFAGRDSFFIRFRFMSADGKPRRAGVRFAVKG